jgi:outer membrane receptor protein involved in Fe transport
MFPASVLGQEVVVAATRTPQRILESPVTIERMSNITLRNVPAPSYYEAITNLKGVDMHTASLTFRTVTTRGFVASGNTRLNQLIDGMDNQAPGLNFAVGSVIGLTELDVESIELLPGASSALYGSGGMNGTLLLNSKSPFQYKGLSFQIKQGIMHINDRQRGTSPYYDWGLRWGKAINDKFAFKIATQFLKANDWEAYDYNNVLRTGILSKIIPGNRTTDPNYDGINIYGDETSANLAQLAGLIQGRARAGVLAATNNMVDIVQVLSALPANATPAQQTAFLDALPAQLQPLRPTIQGIIPFNLGLRNGTIPNQIVSRTGYEERYLVDYNTLNYKITGGLFYKITPSIEVSWNSYLGTGTTVYTGADRYALKNLKMAQHKLEVRSPGWFVRGYTTQENAGDSYNATALGRLMNEAQKPSLNPNDIPNSWYVQYMLNYSARVTTMGNFAAHIAARSAADQGRLQPGTEQFNTLANQIKNRPIRSVNSGAKFLDKSDLYVGEAQLTLSDVLNFSESMPQIIVGTQWKQYVLNSQGTIFVDTTGAIKVSEYGGYAQLRQKFFDKFTVTLSGRYDKHENFEGRFTPRISGVLEVAPDHFIRASYQTAYIFPSNRDQYINLLTGSGRLIGTLPQFQPYFGLDINPAFTGESVTEYRRTGTVSVLQQANFRPVTPESVTSYELGYKAVVAGKLLLDAYGYLSRYSDFIGTVTVVQPVSPSTRNADLLNPFIVSNYGYVQNREGKVDVIGWGATAEYQMARRFVIYGNVYSDKLQDIDVIKDPVTGGEQRSFVTFFNAPELRFNVGLRNENIWRGVGFNVVYKWQDENYYESTFVTGTLPSFGMVDAQVSYKIPNSRAIFRLGGSNITNNYYRTGYGSPYVGGLYYVSFGYNIF